MKSIEELYSDNAKYPVRLESPQVLHLVEYCGIEFMRAKAMFESGRGGHILREKFIQDMLFYSHLELDLVNALIEFDNVEGQEGAENKAQLEEQIATLMLMLGEFKVEDSEQGTI